MSRSIALITSNPKLVENLVEKLEAVAGIQIPVAIFIYPGTGLSDRVRDLWRLLVRRARINQTNPVAQFFHHLAYKWVSRRDGSQQPPPHQQADEQGSAYRRLADGRRLLQAKTVNDPEVAATINAAQVDLTVVFGADVFRRSTLKKLQAPIINVHCSDPRQVRGMPPVFWEIRDDLDQLTLTVHDWTPARFAPNSPYPSPGARRYARRWRPLEHASSPPPPNS